MLPIPNNITINQITRFIFSNRDILQKVFAIKKNFHIFDAIIKNYHDLVF